MKNNKNNSGWDNIDDMSFSGLISTVIQLTDNGNTVKDFNDMINLIEYAGENKDADSVLWAYRIML